MTVPTVWGWVLGHSLREQPGRGQVLGTSHPEARAPRQNPSSAFLHNLINHVPLSHSLPLVDICVMDPTFLFYY